MQIDQNDLDDLKRYVESTLERKNIPLLLDVLESEFEFLLEALPEIFYCDFKERFLALERLLKDNSESLTVERENEFFSQFSTTIFIYGMCLKSRRSN